MKYYKIYLIVFFSIIFQTVIGQEIIIEELTFDEVIKMAREQSPDAIMAKHQFRANYWEFRTYKADFKPNLSLNSEFPNYSSSFKEIYGGDSVYFAKYRTNNSNLNLSLNQNVPFTGGKLSVITNLTRLDAFNDDDEHNYSYSSIPLSIKYSQPILLYNDFKWQKKIEPLKYEEAKKNYISALEDVSLKAVNYFFDLALAQQNLQVAQLNYSNADTLYKIATGRFNIGTIAENELMQMELSVLNAGSSMNSAIVDLEIRKFQLRSFLGFNEKVNLKLIIPNKIPDLTIDMEQALEIARTNNPNIIAFERQLIEAERNVAKARSNKGLQASIEANIGYNKQADEIKNVYALLEEQQGIRLGLSIPIMDWGLGRGKYKMAQSSQEVIKTTVGQSRTDFIQNVYLNVMQFNLQDDQYLIAAKSDTIAQKRYDMTKQRFLIGKVDILDLNVALSEKDGAKTNYISALRKYWSNFYNLRKITLYDFIKDQSLNTNFEELID